MLTLTSYIKSLDLYAHAQIICTWHRIDAIAVDEAIWHGMKISEVDETRSMVRNLESVIYEIKLQPMLGIHIPFIFVWIKPGVYVAHILLGPVDMAGI